MLFRDSEVEHHQRNLGQCCYSFDSTRCGDSLTWAQETKKHKTAACVKAYPSPPMSGSLPPTSAGAPAASISTYDLENRPSEGPQDVIRDYSQRILSTEAREQRSTAGQPPQTYQPEPRGSGSYGYQRHDPPPSRPLSYPQLPGPSMPQTHYMTPNPQSSPIGYPVTARPQTMEHPPYTSPKSQRKTKGHVASACVPCKKAHLRCDSQRPCSRCIANGKEDACIDVQHKKRGRPRLRDDRDTRYDPSRPPLPQDAGIRRPLQVYPASGSGPSGYENPLRRTHNYRVLKSQPSESVGPRFLERASASDANIYTPPLSIATRPPEPVLYLTLDLDIVKASPSFKDIIGSPDVTGRRLLDLVATQDQERVAALRLQLQEEQRREQPNYLPPILDRGHQILQGLGFAQDDVSRYELQHQEYWNFLGADGYVRPCPIRVGLAKEGSFFFIVALLSSPPRYGYPSPSPRSRDGSTLYTGTPRTPQSAYTQHTPVSATFDPSRHVVGDTALPPRHTGPPSAQMITHSPGLSSGGPSYSPTPTRPDFAGPSPTYAIPRSNPLPAPRSGDPTSYQLPPIRAQPGAVNTPSAAEGGQTGDDRQHGERSSRLDIGGLIDRPEASGGPR